MTCQTWPKFGSQRAKCRCEETNSLRSQTQRTSKCLKMQKLTNFKHWFTRTRVRC